MNAKTLLHTIPVPSTDFTQEAYWDERRPRPAIRFAYRQNNIEHQGGITLGHVLATRTRAERCCTAWHIEAYDALVEIQDSEWVKEIKAQTDPNWRDKWEMHHYMIYLDSAGCFEVIAASYAVLPEEPT